MDQKKKKKRFINKIRKIMTLSFTVFTATKKQKTLNVSQLS